jgi:hypothetical protein
VEVPPERDSEKHNRDALGRAQCWLIWLAKQRRRPEDQTTFSRGFRHPGLIPALPDPPPKPQARGPNRPIKSLPELP